MTFTADDEIAAELSAWTRETQTFLLQDARTAINDAQKELERLDFLWGRIRFSRSVATAAIKADVRVEGHLVVLANLEVKLLAKSNRNVPVLAALQQYCVLNQILEFHAIAQAQSEKLASLRRFLDRQHDELRTNDANDVEQHVDIVETALERLTHIVHALRTAANVLRLPSKRRFPYSSHVDHTFKSPLPFELVVDFSIHRGDLLVEAFHVASTLKRMARIPDGCATKKEFVGGVCNLRGHKVEILDYASVAVPIPQVEEMLSHLDDLVAWLVRVRDNTKALLDCQPIE